MRPSEVLIRATDYLAKHDVEDPRVNAEVLLMSVLETDRAGLFTRAEGLSSAEARAFGRALCRRCTGEPLQHLTGEQAFRTLTLTVRPGVFIPRPETEVLVEVALERIDDLGVAEPAVADVGTGSGAVAVSIAAERPGARVWATDLSFEAVQLAEENARRAGVRVTIAEGDLLSPLPNEVRGTLDLVVSNPPYVDEADAAELTREVLADPSLALFGGTEVHERLAAEGATWLRPRGWLVMEIGADQSEAVERILVAAGYLDVATEQDLARRDRIVVGRWPEVDR